MMPRRLGIQRLESRMLLAGDVAAPVAGDVSGDGVVDQHDVHQILAAISRSAEEVDLSLDVSQDGRVTALDALRVIHLLSGRQSSGISSSAGEAETVPGISILDASVVEGHAGAVTLDFVIELSETPSEPVSVDVAVNDDSAMGLRVTTVASEIDSPTYVTSPPGRPDQLMIMEKTGRIKVLDLDTNVVAGTPFLHVTDLRLGFEQGMLGLAFHPDYANNRRFFIYMTATNGDSIIREYTANADGETANGQSAKTILRFSQPYSNHNGGWIDFGPDGYLYIASGDGGSANDPQGNAQDVTNNLLGKMLRIDVDGDDFPSDANRNYAIPATNPMVGVTGDDEIWAYGLRNPWRNSFDRLTGDLYIADVGQNRWEEINVQPADSAGGENYGWLPREGLIATPNHGGSKPEGAIDPIYVYEHSSGPFDGFSVTGGYVYRGPIRELQGSYFFADYVRSQTWSLRFNGDAPEDMDGTNFTDLTRWTTLLIPEGRTIRDISSFGEDADGNLYILDYRGYVDRIEGGGDFLPKTETVTFAAGETSKTFSVEVLGDRLPESAERVQVVLSNPVGGQLSRAEAIGTILNDDAPRVESVEINGGDQQRSVIDALTVQFDSEVVLDESEGPAFELTNTDNQTAVGFTKDVTIEDGRTTVRFEFIAGPTVDDRGSATETLSDGNYELLILGGRVEIGGLNLDADGDGVSGGDFLFNDEFFRRYGDINANGVVDLTDFGRFRGTFNAVRGDDAFVDELDSDGDGVVNLDDFAAFRANYGV